MYRGLIQEAEDSFASKALCSFVEEGRCDSSSAPVVAPSIFAGHVLDNQVAVVVGAALTALTAPGTVLIGSGTALADTGSVALWPGVIAQTGIGPSASAGLRPVPCHQ